MAFSTTAHTSTIRTPGLRSVCLENFSFTNFITTPDRRQSKTLKLLNAYKKMLETEFSIAICRPPGDKWQPKKLFLAILIRIPRLLRTFSIAAYPV